MRYPKGLVEVMVVPDLRGNVSDALIMGVHSGSGVLERSSLDAGARGSYIYSGLNILSAKMRDAVHYASVKM